MDTQTQVPVNGADAAARMGDVAVRTSHIVTAKSELLLDRVLGSDLSPEVFNVMMARYEAMRKDECETLFRAAKAAARADVGTIIKNQRNKHTNSDYADLDQILEKLVPAISAHGLDVDFDPFEAPQGMVGLSIVVSGHGYKDTPKKLTMPLDGAGAKGNANKNGAQAVMSTLTYLQRALVRMAFNLSTGADDDGNYGQEVQVMPVQMVNHITDLLISTGTRLQAFLGNYQVAAIPDLTPDQANHAIAKLEEKAAKGGNS
jgi:hypothetical protein